MSLDPIGRIPNYYEIQLSGQLSQEIAEWFGMALTVKHHHQGRAISILSGQVSDQAALFGILNRVRDLGLKLISVNQIESNLENNTDNDFSQRRNDDYKTE